MLDNAMTNDDIPEQAIIAAARFSETCEKRQHQVLENVLRAYPLTRIRAMSC
jgi:hypothetical protein